MVKVRVKAQWFKKGEEVRQKQMINFNSQMFSAVTIEITLPLTIRLAENSEGQKVKLMS